MSTTAPTKLEQAKTIEAQIKEVEKHEVLINKIIDAFAQEGKGIPPICIKVSAQYGNYMQLDPRFIPGDSAEFYKDYLGNITGHKERLNKELSAIFA